MLNQTNDAGTKTFTNKARKKEQLHNSQNHIPQKRAKNDDCATFKNRRLQKSWNRYKISLGTK